MTKSEKMRGNKNGVTHGSCNTKEYVQWENMKASCNNPNHKQYKNYGAKGILVCDRWNKSFIDFLSDIGKKPSDEHVFRRKDNNGNFEPDNCHWTTHIEGGINSKGQLVKGRKTWNEGLPCQNPFFVKGHPYRNTGKTRFKSEDVIRRWDSNRADRYSLHYWVKKMKGRPKKCELCGTEEGNIKNFHWANKSGEYKKELDDWLRLCVTCHHRYDRNRIVLINQNNQ